MNENKPMISIHEQLTEQWRKACRSHVGQSLWGFAKVAPRARNDKPIKLTPPYGRERVELNRSYA